MKNLEKTSKLFIKGSIVNNLSKIASGAVGQPVKKIKPSLNLFLNNPQLLEFSKCHYRLMGAFDNHYWASIPYVFEQECRLGLGILKYSHFLKTNPLTLWCLGMAEATLARSLSELGNGNIVSFANTGSEANKISFLSRGKPKFAYLHVGFFKNINKKLLKKYSTVFSKGFDLIIEDTTFQMISRERLEPIKRIKKLLKRNGILILTEKFKTQRYKYWEDMKDYHFKSKYFSKMSIENKRKEVLSEMKENQVSLNEIKEVTSKLFSFGLIFWNSGNFYSIALSNDINNLIGFISGLPPACISKKFSSERKITPLFGVSKQKLGNLIFDFKRNGTI